LQLAITMDVIMTVIIKNLFISYICFKTFLGGGHSFHSVGRTFRVQRYVQTEQCVPLQVEILLKNRIFFVLRPLGSTIWGNIPRAWWVFHAFGLPVFAPIRRMFLCPVLWNSRLWWLGCALRSGAVQGTYRSRWVLGRGMVRHIKGSYS